MAKINMIGYVSGRLTVIAETKEKYRDGQIMWLCQCTCGNTIKVPGNKLRSGAVQSCGCMKKVNDMIGKKFGRLTVIAKDEELSNLKKVQHWICECECGTKKTVRGTALRAGEIKSCGCLQREKSAEAAHARVEDLTGQKFGKLTVIERDQSNMSQVFWICECECGNKKSISRQSLISGRTQSCGCINYSIGEQNIEKILIDNNIKYQRQYSFSDLPRRYFDFALFDENNNLLQLVEFDGPQHYNPIYDWYDEKQVIRDQEKDEYCLKNNIKLVRISYFYRDNITLQLILGETKQNG